MRRRTSEEIAAAIERAEQMGRHRSVKVMADMKTQFDSRGCLSDRQWDYLNKLMLDNCKAALVDFNEYFERFTTDKEFREKAEVVSRYYQGAGQYYVRAATQTLIALKSNDKNDLPPYHSFSKMINNKYADKVWDSHSKPPLYSAGDLIKIRSTGINRIWSQRKSTEEEQAGIENLNSHPCLVIKANAKPITTALQYKPKQGGARVYSVMPVGSTLIYYILECDLKKNRTPKAKK